MIKTLFSTLIILISTVNLSYSLDFELKKDFVVGDPEISSISAMSFGPEGILFLGDSKKAEVVAIDLSKDQSSKSEKVGMKDIDGQLAQLLGSSKDQIGITDMAVNPTNQNIYISVMHSSGKALLFRADGSQLIQIPLSKISHSKALLIDPIAANAKDRRGRELRKWSISDMHYSNGKLFVSGLSNREFASTFRSIGFPFGSNQSYSSLEIYHAAHGQYETHSPIKAFTTAEINGSAHLVASYTCTPLVIIPLTEMKAGEHSKGRTVAELGNANTPLDIIEMEKDGNRFILMANTSRALMKIKVKDIEAFGDSMTTPVEERSATAGVDFINLPFVNVQHLARLNDKEFLLLQRQGNGDLVLRTIGDRWL